MSNNLIECSSISVNCVANDSVDIRCGGPQFLGFDFFVEKEKAEEMLEFIVITLKAFEVPLKNIYISGEKELEKKDIWTKERIVESIMNDAEYLQTEAQSNYRNSFRR